MIGSEFSKEAEEASSAPFIPFMRRAIELARSGPQFNANPQVGCVLLDEQGRVLGEGWHMGVGTDHAEVMALKAAGVLAAGVPHTAVVTLEPCNHTGRTGPCVQALLAAGVRRVVYALGDPKCGGAEALRAAGVTVHSGVLAEPAQELCQAWRFTQRHQLPWVIAKWAQSLDGKIAAADGSSQWISSAAARAHLHLLRYEVDAIAVGTGTLLRDKPSLQARCFGGTVPYVRQPQPVIFTHLDDQALKQNLRSALTPWRLKGEDLAADLHQLFQRGVRSLLVEGGGALLNSFIKADLVQQYCVYVAPKLLGGGQGVLTDIGVGSISQSRNLQLQTVTALGDNLLLTAVPVR